MHGCFSEATSQAAAEPAWAAPGQEQERRAGALLLRQWQASCRDGQMPTLVDLELARHVATYDGSFLLREDVDPASSVFILCGERARAVYGASPIGRTLIDMLPAAVRRSVGESCQAALRLGRPAVAEGQYQTGSGGRLYRGVFAPVRSENPGNHARCGFLLGTYGERAAH